MKNVSTKTVTLSLATLLTGLGMGAHAATLTGTYNRITNANLNNNAVGVDLRAGNGKFVGHNGTVNFSSDSIVDYAFFQSGSDNNTGLTPVLAGSSTEIGTTTLGQSPEYQPYAGGNPGASGTGNTYAGTDDHYNFWTSTAPDNIDLLLAGNSEASISMRGQDITTTVDLSSLSSGRFYVLGGGNEGTSWEGILSGPSVSDITVDLATPVQFGHYVAQFDFQTVGGYDTLTVTYNSGDEDGSFARFGGFVLTTVAPEPSSLALLGLGAVMLSRKRRKLS